MRDEWPEYDIGRPSWPIVQEILDDIKEEYEERFADQFGSLVDDPPPVEPPSGYGDLHGTCGQLVANLRLWLDHWRVKIFKLRLRRHLHDARHPTVGNGKEEET